MGISPVGTTRFKVYGVLLLVNTIILALSGHINHFQGFYYVADVFPFVLSLITEVFVLTMLFLDINFKRSFTARPKFELGWLLALGIIWLIFNAFSTSRWRYVGSSVCGTIPSGSNFSPYRTWCNEVQALRVFVWAEWVSLLFMFAFILNWAVKEHRKGRIDVWETSISRYDQTSPFGIGNTSPPSLRAPSEFLQWEKFSPQPESQQYEQQQQQYYPEQQRQQFNQYGGEPQYATQRQWARPTDMYPSPPPVSFTGQEYAEYIAPAKAGSVKGDYVYYGEP